MSRIARNDHRPPTEYPIRGAKCGARLFTRPSSKRGQVTAAKTSNSPTFRRGLPMFDKIQLMALMFIGDLKARRDERGATAVEYG